MGARASDVRIQIFADTFLAVLISFVLAILMMHDLLPVFNQVVSVDFSPGYFYSKDFYPILILFIVVLTVIPAWIMSRKISRLSGSDYRLFFATRKNRWIGTLITVQFVVAFALITPPYGKPAGKPGETNRQPVPEPDRDIWGDGDSGTSKTDIPVKKYSRRIRCFHRKPARDELMDYARHVTKRNRGRN